MSAIKYVGRTTDFKGKTLWEIVGNLKNFGVGRVVVRSMFERYPEKSFLRILKVEAQPNENVRKVKVTVEKVFRGKKYAKPIEILSASYKADYRLISKDEEKEYCNVTAVHAGNVIPKTIDFPPLLREFIIKETGNQNPQLPIRIQDSHTNAARLAGENEQPNPAFYVSINNKNESLYKDIV